MDAERLGRWASPACRPDGPSSSGPHRTPLGGVTGDRAADRAATSADRSSIRGRGEVVVRRIEGLDPARPDFLRESRSGGRGADAGGPRSTAGGNDADPVADRQRSTERLVVRPLRPDARRPETSRLMKRMFMRETAFRRGGVLWNDRQTVGREGGTVTCSKETGVRSVRKRRRGAGPFSGTLRPKETGGVHCSRSSRLPVRVHRTRFHTCCRSCSG